MEGSASTGGKGSSSTTPTHSSLDLSSIFGSFFNLASASSPSDPGRGPGPSPARRAALASWRGASWRGASWRGASWRAVAPRAGGPPRRGGAAAEAGGGGRGGAASATSSAFESGAELPRTCWGPASLGSHTCLRLMARLGRRPPPSSLTILPSSHPCELRSELVGSTTNGVASPELGGSASAARASSISSSPSFVASPASLPLPRVDSPGPVAKAAAASAFSARVGAAAASSSSSSAPCCWRSAAAAAVDGSSSGSFSLASLRRCSLASTSDVLPWSTSSACASSPAPGSGLGAGVLRSLGSDFSMDFVPRTFSSAGSSICVSSLSIR
mmetsp:Transcript_28048/g.53389  ORF Transcript_28048/g.53389 Transcript_28048/m.53389 type:complete len:329 (-) Transcript_28048:1020-2006(-)